MAPGARPVVDVSSSQPAGIQTSFISRTDFIAVISISNFTATKRVTPTVQTTTRPTSRTSPLGGGLRRTWGKLYLAAVRGLRFLPISKQASTSTAKRARAIRTPSSNSAGDYIAYNYADTTVHPQNGTGILIGETITSGQILVEENTFDHNGWMETVANPTIFVHNAYIQGMYFGGAQAPVTAVGNIFARDGQGSQFRSGGSVTNNLLFVTSPYAFALGQPRRGISQHDHKQRPARTGLLTSQAYPRTSSQRSPAYQNNNFAQGQLTLSGNIPLATPATQPTARGS